MNIKIIGETASQGITLSYPDQRYAPVTQYTDINSETVFEGVENGFRIDPANENDKISAVLEIEV